MKKISLMKSKTYATFVKKNCLDENDEKEEDENENDETGQNYEKFKK